MSRDREGDLARLLTPLLLAAERTPGSDSDTVPAGGVTGGPADPPSPTPWDAELAAAFVAGELSAAEAEVFLARLDDDPAARETVALLLDAAEPTAQTVSFHAPLEAPLPPTIRRRGMWRAWAVAAAALLCAAGAFVLLRTAERPGEEVADAREAILQDLRAGEFQRAERRWRAALAEFSSATSSETSSAAVRHLRSLGAPIALRLPGPISLQHQGALTDYGYQLGGVAPRGAVNDAVTARAQFALNALQGATGLEAALNRGQALLLARRPREAAAVFFEAMQLDPESPEAALGAGLSAFEQGRFESAVRHFRRARQLQPALAAARINLAMALEECGEFREAWTLWQSLAVEETPAPLRRQLELHLPELEQHLEAPP